MNPISVNLMTPRLRFTQMMLNQDPILEVDASTSAMGLLTYRYDRSTKPSRERCS